MNLPPPSLAIRAGRLFVICAGPSLGGLVPLALAIDQPALAAHFGGGPDGTLAARTLFSTPSLMIIAGAPLGGVLAERFGYRLSLLIALLIYAVSGSAGLILDGFAPLLASRLVLGLAGGAVMAIYLALAASYYDGAARARALGYAVASSAVVGMAALALGGGLVEWGGWRAPFALYLSGFLVLAVAWAAVRGPFHRAARIAPQPGAPGKLALILQLWPIYLALMILSIGTFTTSAGGPFLLGENGIASAKEQGFILAFGSSPSILTAFFYGSLRRIFSDRALIVLTALAMGAGIVMVVPLHGRAVVLATFALIGLGAGIKAPATSSVLMAAAPESVRAAAAGLSFSGIFLGQFLAPMLLEFLGRLFGIHGAFLAIGGTLLLVALLVAIFGIGRETGRPGFTAKPQEIA